MSMDLSWEKSLIFLQKQIVFSTVMKYTMPYAKYQYLYYNRL